MTLEESIKHCEERAKICDECGKEHAQLAEWLKEVKQYREMDKKLREAFGDCDGLLETAVDSLCRHEGEDIGSPVKSRLLTDETVDVWDAYQAIGTVEECQKALERRKPKRAVLDCMIGNWEGRFNCPACGKVILRDCGDVENTFCERCGQAIRWG